MVGAKIFTGFVVKFGYMRIFFVIVAGVCACIGIFVLCNVVAYTEVGGSGWRDLAGV